MMPDTDDAFERAADIEYRLQEKRRRNDSALPEVPAYGSLAWARWTFHQKISGLLFLLATFGLHWYLIQRVTNWVIAHGVLIVLSFLGLVKAWGDQRVAEARLLERRDSSDD